MKRTPMARGRVRVGATSSKRRRQGGKIAPGRDSESVAGYRSLTERLKARSASWCEIHSRPCRGTEVCHVVARSAGGPDDDWNCYWGCRAANSQQQAPFAKGRLVAARVMKHGVKGIDWVVIRAAGKVAYLLGEWEPLTSGFIPTEGRSPHRKDPP